MDWRDWISHKSPKQSQPKDKGKKKKNAMEGKDGGLFFFLILNIF